VTARLGLRGSSASRSRQFNAARPERRDPDKSGLRGSTFANASQVAQHQIALLAIETYTYGVNVPRLI
jgi:hypothetical protein